MTDQLDSADRAVPAAPPAPRPARTPADAKRRSQAVIGALGGVAVIAVLVGVFVAVQVSDDDPAPAPAAAAAPSAAPGTPEAAPTDLPTDLPTGAPTAPPAPEVSVDPALAKKPVVAKGTGKVAKVTTKLLITGKGPKTAPGQPVNLHFVGAEYLNGKEFVSTYERGQPAQAQIGALPPPGWNEALTGVPVGSRVQLDVPEAVMQADPNSQEAPKGDLRFVIDVLPGQ